MCIIGDDLILNISVILCYVILHYIMLCYVVLCYVMCVTLFSRRFSGNIVFYLLNTGGISVFGSLPNQKQ